MADAAAYELGERLALGTARADAFLVAGFSFLEDWGRWTDGPRARIVLRHGCADGLLLVELWVARAFAGEEGCTLVVEADWAEPRLFTLAGGAARLAFPADVADARTPGTLRLDLAVPRPKRADEPPADARALGVGLEALRVTRLPRG